METLYWYTREESSDTQYILLWQYESEVKVAQSCPTLYDPLDYTDHGIFQARILEWVATPFSRGSSQPGIEPRSPTLQADSLPAELRGKPMIMADSSIIIKVKITQQWLSSPVTPGTQNLDWSSVKLTAHTYTKYYHCSDKYRHTLKTLQFWFQTTTIKWILQKR